MTGNTAMNGSLRNSASIGLRNFETRQDLDQFARALLSAGL